MEIYDSPIGQLVLRGEAGVLTGVGLRREGMAGAREASLGPVRDQLDAYFAGELQDIDVPLELRGPPFDPPAWGELRSVPVGETVAYGGPAARIGEPGEAGKVGAAL